MAEFNTSTISTKNTGAFGFSMLGLKICYQSEVAFRQELWFGVVLISLAFWLKESAIERVLLIAPVFLVLIVESKIWQSISPFK
jgi:diacylglycerol kinase (ATP)